MARGRSTSSSPDAHRHRGKRDRRTSRRSRSPRRKSTGLPVETPTSTTTFETRYPIRKAWSSDDIYLDRQQEYKLTFPRRVLATASSRELHIDHQPIEDVRLIDVLSRKQENWALRLVATTAGWSSTRDSGIVKRPTYGPPSPGKSLRAPMLTSPASSVTFILLPSRTTTGMRSAKAWIALQIAFSTIYVIRCPRTLEALQDQVEQLMKENEKLKAATGRTSSDSPVLSPSEPETPADRERSHHPTGSSSLGTHLGQSLQAIYAGTGEGHSTSCCSCGSTPCLYCRHQSTSIGG